MSLNGVGRFQRGTLPNGADRSSEDGDRGIGGDAGSRGTRSRDGVEARPRGGDAPDRGCRRAPARPR
jgi:hypothetical protein